MEPNRVSSANNSWGSFRLPSLASIIMSSPVLATLVLIFAATGCTDDDSNVLEQLQDGGIYPTPSDGGTDETVEDGDTSTTLPTEGDADVPALGDLPDRSIWEITLSGGSHMVEARNITFEGSIHASGLSTLTNLGLEIGSDPCPEADACIEGLANAPETCFDGLI
ncbi:MAG: hypothetical protein WCT39_07020, partial [Candidatus Margulisiibacteriota bacterium]